MVLGILRVVRLEHTIDTGMNVLCRGPCGCDAWGQNKLLIFQVLNGMVLIQSKLCIYFCAPPVGARF